MRDGSIGSSKVHSSSRAYISAEMSFKGQFSWTDLQVHQQTQRHFFQWLNFIRPGAFLLLQPRSGYFYFVCQKGSFTLHAFSLRNRVSCHYCQEHIIFATEATLGKLCASLVLTGVHKCFCSRHKGPEPKCPAQVFWVATWFQHCPSLSWGRGSCTGLLVPASTGASCPAPPPRRQRCLQDCMHCLHRQHLGRDSREGAKMLYLDLLGFFSFPGIPSKQGSRWCSASAHQTITLPKQKYEQCPCRARLMVTWQEIACSGKG